MAAEQHVGPPPALPRPEKRVCPAVDAAPPPGQPAPWCWRCHRCRRVYRLACTRRCLACGHTLCYRRRRRRCRTEFDYACWAACGRWRRLRAAVAAAAHDCSVHCDYPSQCRRAGLRGCGRRSAASRGCAVVASVLDERGGSAVDADGEGDVDVVDLYDLYADTDGDGDGNGDFGGSSIESGPSRKVGEPAGRIGVDDSCSTDFPCTARSIK